MNRHALFAGLVVLPFLPLHAENSFEDVSLRLSELEARVAMMEAEKSGVALQPRWQNGFFIEAPDKSFKLQLGGRMHLDTAFFSADDELEAASGSFEDGVKFRRVRLYMRGTIYDRYDFVTEYDFSGSGSFQSVYMGVREIPVIGNLRAGHMLEPMGLEELCSNNHVTFMERGSSTAINPVFNTGIMAFNNLLDRRMTWAAGIFKDTGAYGDSVSNEAWAVTARLTGLPYYADDGKAYLHLGGSASLRDLDDESYRVRSRPESSIAPYVVDTKSISSDGVDLYGLEALLTLHSFSLQSEWIVSSVDRLPDDDGTAAEDVTFDSFYIMASYFLTGEYRPYSKISAITGRVTPLHNATGKQWGSGAWEIAARYDAMDLNDKDIEGGELETYTIGLNWYLNPHARIMFNYVAADVVDVGEADIFEMRFQVDI